MKYLYFENGDSLPALGLGTWKSAKGEVYGVIRKAIEIGYRHFDCAHLYGNEKEIGDAFADAFKVGDIAREELFITSKLWNNRHRRAQVRPAYDLTLTNLQIGYLDLYLIHWPVVVIDHKDMPETGADLVSLTKTPLAETWEAMIDVTKTGLIKHIGVSNFSIAKIEDIWHKTGVKPAVNQVEIHPYMQQKALKNYTDQHHIILTGYSPLGSFDRPASRRAAEDPILLEDETLHKIAHQKGITTAQLVLAWAVNYGISTIPKSVKENRLRENLVAADIILTHEEMEQISQIDRKSRFIKGNFWCLEGSDYTLQNLWDEG